MQILHIGSLFMLPLMYVAAHIWWQHVCSTAFTCCSLAKYGQVKQTSLLHHVNVNS